MSTARVLVLFLLIAFSPTMDGQTAVKATDPVPPTTAASSAQPAQPKQTDVEMLLKYQEFLRKEAEAANARLKDLVDRVRDTIYVTGLCIAVIAMLCGVFGFRTYRQVVDSAAASTKARIDTEAEQRVQEARARVERELSELHHAFDARIAHLEKVYERRQDKYLQLLKDYFSVVFDGDPNHRKLFLGDHFDGGKFRGKKILWVEDDAVGIALLVQLLECCGLEIQIRASTKAALADSLGNYDLIISNLRRDPDENAGLLLAQALRAKQCRLPIIIFTRPARVAYYRDLVKKADATLVASRQDLFARIADDLAPKPEGVIVDALGQS